MGHLRGFARLSARSRALLWQRGRRSFDGRSSIRQTTRGEFGWGCAVWPEDCCLGSSRSLLGERPGVLRAKRDGTYSFQFSYRITSEQRGNAPTKRRSDDRLAAAHPTGGQPQQGNSLQRASSPRIVTGTRWCFVVYIAPCLMRTSLPTSIGAKWLSWSARTSIMMGVFVGD